jgi:hypothetical protein
MACNPRHADRPDSRSQAALLFRRDNRRLANSVRVLLRRNAQGRDKSARVDLGMSLVTLGYGFASLKLDGTPVHQPYLAAQQLAKSSKAGLWAYPDLPEPNAVMLQAARRREATSPNASPPGSPDR